MSAAIDYFAEALRDAGLLAEVSARDIMRDELARMALDGDEEAKVELAEMLAEDDRVEARGDDWTSGGES